MRDQEKNDKESMICIIARLSQSFFVSLLTVYKAKKNVLQKKSFL